MADSGRTRVLGLGNEILADDAFGPLVARRAGQLFPDEVEVVCSTAAGFQLLDDLLGVSRLLVVDTILTGKAEPGAIFTLREEELSVVPGAAPHCTGLFEALALARALRLPAPREVILLAVEAADCSTVGGAMHPAVEAAIPAVAARIGEFLAKPLSTPR